MDVNGVYQAFITWGPHPVTHRSDFLFFDGEFHSIGVSMFMVFAA
jgi:hypothetical protein